MEGAQAYFLFANLKIRDVILVDARLLRKVNLSPPALFAKITDSFSKRDADVPCHPHYSRASLDSKSRL